MWNLLRNVPRKDLQNVPCQLFVLTPFVYRWSLYVEPLTECPSERPSECFVLSVRVASFCLLVVATYGTFHRMSLKKNLRLFCVSGACCLNLFTGGRYMWNLSWNVPQKDPPNVPCQWYVLPPFVYRWSLHVKPFAECSKTLRMFHVNGTYCLHLFTCGRYMGNLSRNVSRKDPPNVSC